MFSKDKTYGWFSHCSYRALPLCSVSNQIYLWYESHSKLCFFSYISLPYVVLFCFLDIVFGWNKTSFSKYQHECDYHPILSFATLLFSSFQLKSGYFVSLCVCLYWFLFWSTVTSFSLHASNTFPPHMMEYGGGACHEESWYSNGWTWNSIFIWVSWKRIRRQNYIVLITVLISRDTKLSMKLYFTTSRWFRISSKSHVILIMHEFFKFSIRWEFVLE